MITRLVLMLPLVLAPAIARADAKIEAQVHVDKATALFEAGKSEEAILELKDAYALDPRPELLYALGQAHASLGQCDKAKVFYDRFVEVKPGEAAVASEAAAACKEAPAPPKKVEPPPPKKIEPPPPPAPVSRAWYSDTLGLVIAGAGLVLGGVGAVEFSAASKARKTARAAGDYDTFLDGLDDEAGKRKLAIGFTVAGGAALVAGAIHIVLRARVKEPVGESPLRITPAPDGAAVSWLRRF